MLDILIRGGILVDGSGQPGRRGDVGIKGDRIAAVGELHDERGEIEINAEGRLVCPGFIDVNNHSDTYWQIFLDPDLESLLYQGVTTIVGGNCGSSLAPLASAKNIESIQKWTDLSKVNVNWLSLKEFFDFISTKSLSLNFATLVGHGTLRRGILGDQMRSPNPKELAFINSKLTEAMKDGALGMSTGLIYTHARMATLDELVDLAKTVKKYDGVYTTHLRGEADELTESIEEAVSVAEKSKVKLHVSHLKAVGAKNWPKMEDAQAMLERLAENGLDVTFDVYPYTNIGSVLYTLLPPWISEGGKKMMLGRLKDPAIRSKIIDEMRRSIFEYDKIEIASSGLDKTLTRRKITDIARAQGKSIEDAIVDILIASDGRVITSAEVLSETNIRNALRSPLSIVATNGSGYSEKHSQTGEVVHPRSFGAMIKVLAQYVQKEEVLTWEEAIRKMTGLPAEKFNLAGRGRLAKNYFADVTILNPEKLASPATADNPYQYSRGVEYVLVNGKVVLKEGVYQGVRKGRIIKK